MLPLQHIILEMIATGSTLEATADRLCCEVEALLPGVICSVLTVDRGGFLRPLSAPSLPLDYSAALDGIPIGHAADSCVTAAYLKKPVAVADVARDPKWTAFRHLVLPLGLAACWSSPISDASGMVLGTFAIYYRERRGAVEGEIRRVSCWERV